MKGKLAKIITLAVLLVLAIVMGKLSTKTSFGADNEERAILEGAFTKYVNYELADGSKGTLVQYSIRTGIKYEKDFFAIRNTELNASLSPIDGKYPYDVRVITNNTKATNGKTSDISEDYSYDPITGIVTIRTNNENEKGEAINNARPGEDDRDEFVIIGYYDIYTKEKVERELSCNVTYKAELFTEDKREVIGQGGLSNKVTEDVGELTTVRTNVSEIYNGYIKSNIINGTTYDTEYTENNEIEISKKEAHQKIKITEENTFINPNDIYYKSTKISKDDITKVLGENGSIEIIDGNNNVIAKVDNNTEFNENGEYIVTYGEEVNNITIRTSNIEKEGILHIENVKVLRSNISNIEDKDIVRKISVIGINEKEVEVTEETNLEEELNEENKEQTLNLNTETLNLNINTNENDKTIKSKENQNEDTEESKEIKTQIIEEECYKFEKEDIFEIKDTVTNVGINMDNKNWTNEKQNDVIFNILLDSSSVKNNLFVNPSIRIKLPSEVENVILKDNQIIYANGLELQEAYVENDENGNLNIVVNLLGSQTLYDLNEIGLITNVKINATIILKKDIQNAEQKVNVEYTNNYDINGNVEYGKIETQVSIINYEQKEDNNKNNFNNQNEILDTITGVVENKIKEEVFASQDEIDGLNVNVKVSKGDSPVDDGDILYEGEFLKYTITLKNTTDNPIDNVKVVGAIPEGLRYGELNADYYSFEGKYEYLFDDKLTEKEIEIGTIKAGETITKFYEVQVEDLAGEDTEKEVVTNIKTYIGSTESFSYDITNIIKKSDVRAFYWTTISGAENGWHFAVNLDNPEGKEVTIEINVPEGYEPSDYEDSEIPPVLGYEGEFGYSSIHEGKFLPLDSYSYEADGTKFRITTNQKSGVFKVQGILPPEVIRESYDSGIVMLESYANIIVDDVTYKPNEVRFEYAFNNVSVNMTSENEGQEVKYGEEINYNIEVNCVNTQNAEYTENEARIYVNILDYLPENVKPVSMTYEYYETEKTTNEEGTEMSGNLGEKQTKTVDISGEKTDQDGNSLADVDIYTWIPKGETINIEVKTTAGYVYEKTEIENSVVVQGDDINTKTSNVVKHIILPYGYEEEIEEPDTPDNPDIPDNPNNPDNPDNPDEPSKPETKYNISGVAWSDVNGDGKRQSSEELLSGIQVLLVDLSDSSNIKAQTTTTNGRYEFKDLDKANYIVVFRYNTTLYMLTEYKKSGISDDLNSDAMEQNIIIDGQRVDVGVTDEINLTQNAENIDIGLIEKEGYDLKLDKYITDVSVTTVNGTKQYSYDNTKLGRVEIRAKELNGAEVSIKYRIVITNEGKSSATVKEIYDYLPNGLDFDKDMNTNWINEDGKLVNRSLTGQSIKPGESKEITLILTKTMNEENTGTFTNAAEIGDVDNGILGIEDVDSTPGNQNKSEDDYSEAELIIGVSTGLITYISIGIAVVSILIIVAILITKKKINIGKIAKVGMILLAITLIQLGNSNYFVNASYLDPQTYTYVRPNPFPGPNTHTFLGGPTGSAWCISGDAYRAAGYWEYGCTDPENGYYFWTYGEWSYEYSYTEWTPEEIQLTKLNEEVEVRKVGENYILGPFETSSNASEDYTLEVYDKQGSRIDGWAACNSEGVGQANIPASTPFYISIDAATFESRGVSRVVANQERQRSRIKTTKRYASIKYKYSPRYCSGGGVDHQNVITTGPKVFIDSSETTEYMTDKKSVEWTQFNSTLDILKVDADDHEIFIDIEGTIEKDDGTFSQTFKTENGRYHLDNIKPGNYIITETSNENYGYEKNEGIQVTVPVDGGTAVIYYFENIKYTGNLKIIKKDKDSGSLMPDVGFKLQAEEGYVIGIDDNGNKITTARGQVHFSNMEYTQNIDEATEFFTDDNGVSEILNIRIGTYNVIETSIKIDKYGYELDDEYIFWSSNMGSGQGAIGQVEVIRRESFITTPKNHTLTDSDYDIITFENRRKWIKLSGDVWEDMISGKTSERDYRYTSGDSTENNPDKLVANVVVKLKDASGNTVPFKTEETASKVISGDYDGSSDRGTTVDEILTDENGHYLMIDILIDEIPNYYIEFSYNGMSYASVPVIEMLLNNEKGGTKAIENAEVRAEFNRKYSEITHSGTTGPVGESRDDTGSKTYDLNYDTDQTYDGTDQNKSTLNYGPNSKDSDAYGYAGQKFPVNPNKIDEQYVITATTRDAYLTVSGNSGYLDDMYTPEEIRKQEIEEIENVDLGIYEREQPDLSLIEDIETVQVSLNGYVHTYNYDQRFSAVDPVNEGGFNVGVKFGNEYGKQEYTQTIYSSDVVYDEQNNLEKLGVYVRYKIALRNEATDLYSTVNDIINYYDNRYTIDSIEDDGGNTYNYIDEGDVGDYKKITIQDINQELEPQDVKYVYITYRLNNDAINAVLTDDQEFVNKPLDSVTEIASYSTYTDGFSTHYAGVDKDSRPGSAEPANEETFEDDTDSAPAFKLVLEEGRVIAGTVWEDNAIEELLNKVNNIEAGDYKERIGNGEYEQGIESVVNNVTVDLIVLSNTAGEISPEELAIADLSGELADGSEFGEYQRASLYQRANRGTPVPATVNTGTNPNTGENGYYEFSGVIPGAYLLRFTYGNDSVIVNPDGTTKEIDDVDKYKSTIYRGNRPDNKNTAESDTEYWYRTETSGGEAARWSDARDQVGINGNGKYDIIAERLDNTKRFYYGNTGVESPEKVTAIESRSRGFEIKMDYDINLDNMSTYADQEAGLKFVFDNMDFGIIRRPIQRLDLNKEISYIKVTLANGQVVIEGDPRNEEIEHLKYLPDVDDDGDGCGDVHIELDSELMQGATLTITYEIIADTTDSEVDYRTEDYYIYGIQGTKDDIIAPGIERLFDYLSNDVLYDENIQTNIDGAWKNIRTEDIFDTLVEDGYLSQEAFDVIKNYNQVLSTNAFENIGIDRKSVFLEVSKILTNTAEDLIFDNDIEVNVLTGRRTAEEDNDDVYTIPGDYVPSNGPDGGDNDYRYVTVTGPTGDNQNYIPYIVLGISAFIILGTGIVFIKKKVV